jgi:hypothetical protein
VATYEQIDAVAAVFAEDATIRDVESPEPCAGSDGPVEEDIHFWGVGS